MVVVDPGWVIVVPGSWAVAVNDVAYPLTPDALPVAMATSMVICGVMDHSLMVWLMLGLVGAGVASARAASMRPYPNSVS